MPPNEYQSPLGVISFGMKYNGFYQELQKKKIRIMVVNYQYVNSLYRVILYDVLH